MHSKSETLSFYSNSYQPQEKPETEVIFILDTAIHTNLRMGTDYIHGIEYYTWQKALKRYPRYTWSKVCNRV